ncbi:citramalate synthase [Kineosporia sp. J2-2]|uniref:Citramalate synthase n=1 Tax=Kineosporia corallincola TaxID=2835133 RepID=A0ABS5TF94_9ACTN|nr:citramalate synthase [Kineosporia corallincola]MBT0769755.1 citramalate synthase [Kineosporia corallincola]
MESTGLSTGSGGTFQVYDTTLRDGAQQEGLSLSVQDKLLIAGHLDDLGVGFVEGGWPGAIPKDTEFFRRAAEELTLKNAVLTAFGATRKAGVAVHDDPQVKALIDSLAPAVTLVAKSDIRHVERALRTTPQENLAMITETVRHLRDHGRRVFVDAEHFFDGYRFDRAYALEVVRAAAEAGAEAVVLCDTNGGMLPNQVADVVRDVRQGSGADLGIHCHNDTGCAVANSLAAVDAGVIQVQGTLNGYGERTGNADLITVVADLELKLGRKVLPDGRIHDITRIARAVDEIANVAPYNRQPYVGASAFAHKAGLHASAIKVDPDLYQHIDPAGVGNDMRMLVSDMAGRASIELKGRELGFDLSSDRDLLGRVTGRVKQLEADGYTFEAADASFSLLLHEEVHGTRPVYCDVESWRVITEFHGGAAVCEATVKLTAGGVRTVATAEGNGPVSALDHTLRQALLPVYPELERMKLTDFKVRILDGASATDAVTRVLVETTGNGAVWQTVGVGPNMVEASWQALLESFVYGLHFSGVPSRL